ncbi:MAG: hypothetical protein JST28_16160 [Acidobacteria bacterium]|nr:hypothetical protein [Acidobacteriota bacterium]
MGHRILACFALLLCAEATLSQSATATSTTATINTSLPVAYVYVSSKNYIHAYNAWADGKITSITGSPFPFANIAKMSVTKNFLFGVDSSRNIITYSIHSNGSISKLFSLSTTSWSSGCIGNDGVVTQVDYSQATLYYRACADGGSPNRYLSFHIQSNGSLQFLGGSGGTFPSAPQGVQPDLTKMGGNVFAFDSYCDDDTDQGTIQIFKRQSNGNLIFYGTDQSMPAAAPGSAFCMGPVAADTSTHLAAAVFRIDSQPHDAGFIYGPSYLASYTSDASGNLSTTSNVDNMPSLPVAGDNGVNAISLSPDNKFVAVGGKGNGFQVLHFNGGNPPTKFTGALLAGHYINKFGWDKAGHLYVLSAVYGNGTYTTYFSVFHVSSSGVQKVSGYPKYIANLTNLIVRTLQ